MRNNSQVVRVLLFVLLALACQRSENRYLQRNVQASELLGSWVGTPFAMDSLRYAGFKTHLDPAEHRLSLNPDGSCQAETVVDPSNTSPGGDAWISAAMACRWQLGTDGQHQTLELLVSEAPGVERRMSLYFDEEGGGITLWQYAGDPDAWKYMEFRKSGAG